LASGPSQRSLWRPSPFLERYADLLPPATVGPVLDLACGNGRSAVWLAKHGYLVTGIDWQSEALSGANRLASSCGVVCKFLGGDLRDTASIPAGQWAVLLMFRYLQRDLLSRLKYMMVSGGVAMIRTFRHVPGYQGVPKRKYRLESGELPQYFPPNNFQILVYEENFDPDGFPVAGILARCIK